MGFSEILLVGYSRLSVDFNRRPTVISTTAFRKEIFIKSHSFLLRLTELDSQNETQFWLSQQRDLEKNSFISGKMKIIII